MRLFYQKSIYLSIYPLTQARRRARPAYDAGVHLRQFGECRKGLFPTVMLLVGYVVSRGLFFFGFAKFRFCPGLRALSVLGLLRDAARRRMPGVHDAAALRAAAAIARSRTAGASRTVAYITAPTVAYTISVCWLAAKSHRRAASPIAHRLSKREGREEAPVAQVGRYPYVA